MYTYSLKLIQKYYRCSVVSKFFAGQSRIELKSAVLETDIIPLYYRPIRNFVGAMRESNSRKQNHNLLSYH